MSCYPFSRSNVPKRDKKEHPVCEYLFACFLFLSVSMTRKLLYGVFDVVYSVSSGARFKLEPENKNSVFMLMSVNFVLVQPVSENLGGISTSWSKQASIAKHYIAFRYLFISLSIHFIKCITFPVASFALIFLSSWVKASSFRATKHHGRRFKDTTFWCTADGTTTTMTAAVIT